MTTHLHQLNECLELDAGCPHSRTQTKQCLSSLLTVTGSHKEIADSDWLLIPPDQRNGIFLCWLREMERII